MFKLRNTRFHRILAVGVTTAALVAGALAVGSGTAKADVGANDPELSCSQDSFAITYPHYASPARTSYFFYRVNGGSWQSTTYFYFSGGIRWYWANNAWQSDWWNGFSVAVDGGGTVETFERRYTAATGWFWVDLGSCFVSAYYGGLQFEYHRL